MFTLLRLLPPKRLMTEQLPVLMLAWVIAEFFYKFKSFTLECIAFLVTWFVLDAVYQIVRGLIVKEAPQHNREA